MVYMKDLNMYVESELLPSGKIVGTKRDTLVLPLTLLLGCEVGCC